MAGWYPNEVRLAGRENLDVEHVARYDGKMDSRAEDEVSLLRQHGLGSGSRIVEFGAGTGQFTAAASRAGAHVTAVDVSEPMLEHLRRKIDLEQLDNVEVVHAGFLSFAPEGELADVVYSRYALHHLPDFWKAIALVRMSELLKPGGVLRLWDVVYDFDPADADERIGAWCAQGGTDVDGEWSRAEFEEHVRDEHSTFRWILEPMILKAGFAILDCTYSPETFDAQYVLQRTAT
jgi:ubiquinone/menaquinone biosynthesis C-methylase UbiE